MPDRRAKIVATVGPVTRETGALHALLGAGVDVVRLNYAHDDPDAHARVARSVKHAAGEFQRSVGILADLPGPKMRTGRLRDDEIFLEPDHTFVLSASGGPGDQTRVSTTVPELGRLVSVDDRIFLADGEIILRVVETNDDVITEVVRGGTLRSGKGMHVPGVERKLEFFPAQDVEALRRAVAAGADLIGLSFVRDGDDVRRARASIPKGKRPLIVAKIETRSAVESFDEISDEADAVMVARGDLGIQLRLADVPMIQKEIIRRCNYSGKPVITATQMLDSMTRSPLPTRAEVSDVANAILDGTDAVMLSEETAIGDHPLSAVAQMSEIIAVAEGASRSHDAPKVEELRGDRVSWAAADAAVQAAADLQAAAIVCLTTSGATARKVAAFRPSAPILGVSSDPTALGALALSWGVVPLRVERAQVADLDTAVAHCLGVASQAGWISKGRHAVFVAGSSDHRPGETDLVRVVRFD